MKTQQPNIKTIIKQTKRLRWHIDRYVGRYFPSRKQLERWVYYRFKEEESLVRDILKDFVFPYEESNLARSWIARLIDMGKSRRFIFWRLLRKWFSENLIHECMDAVQDQFSDISRFDQRIQRRIDGLVARGKSSRVIIADVSNHFPDITRLIPDIVHASLGPLGDFDQRQLRNLLGDRIVRPFTQKEFSRLLRLGFCSDTIRATIRNHR